jgi:multisubunit Na+/H+ antiporter MnhC subunit
MIPLSLLNGMIQTIAAVLIFVIGYFVLLFSVINCLLLMALLSKAARLLYVYFSTRSVPGRRLAAMIRPFAATQKFSP